MKKLILAGLFLALASSSASAVDVDGYFTKDGTFVAPHRRTPPDNTRRNNFDYPGNYNPNSGRVTPGDPLRMPEIPNQFGIGGGGGTTRPNGFDRYNEWGK